MLDLRSITRLPVAAALFDQSGAQLAATPEWSGLTLGSVGYAFEGMHLAVAPWGEGDDLEAAAGAMVVARLVDALSDSAARVDDSVGHRLLALAEALQMLTGRAALTTGTTDDVVAYLTAVLPARTDVTVRFHPTTACSVPAPAGIANALLQLVVNAAEHSGAPSVDLFVETAFGAPSFRLQWPGPPPPPEGQLLKTSRRQHRTAGPSGRGTGMVAARVIADAVGARILGPLPGMDPRSGLPDNATTRVHFDLGSRALALPLAKVREGTIGWANTAWLEERLPARGQPVTGQVADIVDAALHRYGTVARLGDLAARTAVDGVWLTQPPDETPERALLAARYIEHERALCVAGPPHEQRARSLATFLLFICGEDLPYVTADAWNDSIASECSAYGDVPQLPRFNRERILDPMLCAFLIHDAADEVVCGGDGHILIHIRPDRRSDAFIHLLAGDRPCIDLCSITRATRRT